MSTPAHHAQMSTPTYHSGMSATIDLASSDGLAGMKVDNDRLGWLTVSAFAVHTVSEGLEGMKVAQRRCGESLRSKLQKVSSEDRRTPVLGQAVNQSAEMQSALEFFATAHTFRERSLESVN